LADGTLVLVSFPGVISQDRLGRREVSLRWNSAMWSDPAFDEKWQQTATERDPAKRNELLKELGVYAVENSLYVMLPLGDYYRYAWPWVRNYYGENTVGAFNSGGI